MHSCKQWRCSNLLANCLRTSLRVLLPFAAVQMDVLGALQQHLGKAKPPARTDWAELRVKKNYGVYQPYRHVKVCVFFFNLHTLKPVQWSVKNRQSLHVANMYLCIKRARRRTRQSNCTDKRHLGWLWFFATTNALEMPADTASGLARQQSDGLIVSAACCAWCVQSVWSRGTECCIPNCKLPGQGGSALHSVTVYGASDWRYGYPYPLKSWKE